MLPFTIENLSKVNRIVVREQREELPEEELSSAAEEEVSEVILMLAEATGSSPDEWQSMPIPPRPDLYVSLFAGRRQVALGAPKQKQAKNGEFTTDLSGLKLIRIFLEAISGKTFMSDIRDLSKDTYELKRSDIRVVPFKRGKKVG